MPIPEFVAHAGRWFLRSGIQDANGGVARYHRTDVGQNLPVSTEITAYTASTLVYLHHLTGAPEYLDAGVRAARFLAAAWDPESGIIPFECGRPAFAYFFDCGIIVRAFLAVWRATGEGQFLDWAVRCGRAMARDFAGSAEWHPILALPEKRPIERDDRWSRNPGCYQLKSAMGWNDLFESTSDSVFFRSYEGLREYALHNYAGFLPGHSDPQKVMDRLHAYLYFLEGLLPCASDRRASAAICDGLRRVAGFLAEIGPCFARSDVYAQLLRMRLYAEWAGVAPVDREAAVAEAAALAGFQFVDANPRIDGGFCFGRRNAELLPYANPVSTAFGLQALALWQQYLAGTPPVHRHLLI